MKHLQNTLNTILISGLASLAFGCGTAADTPDPEYLAVVSARFATADAAANKAGHDAAAGAGQEQAQATGDLAHQVYLGLGDEQQFLALDIWNDRDGMNAFFTDPNVQQAFGQLFDAPPSVTFYQPADGYSTWGSLDPAPGSFLVHVDGRLADGTDEEQRIRHNEVAEGGQPIATSLGDYAHVVYLDPEDNDHFVAIDLWSDLDGLNQFFTDPDVQASFATLFQAPPTVTVYTTTDYLQW